MTTTPAPNPHPEGSRAWIEHEDAYFRDMATSGAMHELMGLIAADARRGRDRDA